MTIHNNAHLINANKILIMHSDAIRLIMTFYFILEIQDITNVATIMNRNNGLI